MKSLEYSDQHIRSASRPSAAGLQSVDLWVAAAASSVRTEGKPPYCCLRGSSGTMPSLEVLVREPTPRQ